MIRFQDVSFSYSPNDTDVMCVKNINLTIEPGQFVVLCGKSGCGKTTLTRLINGLIPHYYEGTLSGCVCVDGNEIGGQTLAKTSRQVGSVFQNPRSQFFNVDTTSEVAFGCENLGMPVPDILSRIEAAGEAFDIENLLGRSIFELSGGEKQRIACASAYAVSPEVFVLDEPSSNLDATSVELLRDALKKLKESGKTIIVSEHRLYYLAALADRYIYLENGRITGEYTAGQLLNMPRDILGSLGLRSPDIGNLSFMSRGPVSQKERNRITVKNMVCKYKKTTVLSIPALSIDSGEIVAVIGHNGAGKSTFAGCFCGITKHKGITFLNDNVFKPKERLKRSYMVMQDVNHQLFTESVMDELTLNIPDEKKTSALYILDEMKIAELAGTHPLALSGGQKQRVAIASAVCSTKEFLLYDEPTSGLDYESMLATCGLIRKASESVTLSLVITHDLEFILNCCTSVIHLNKGAVKDHYVLDDDGVTKILDYFIRKDNVQ